MTRSTSELAAVESWPTPVWSIGERLRKVRTDAQLEQADLAKALGVSRPLISRFEHDKSTIDVEQLGAWARLCEVEVSWLMGIGADLHAGPSGTFESEATPATAVKD